MDFHPQRATRLKRRAIFAATMFFALVLVAMAATTLTAVLMEGGLAYVDWGIWRVVVMICACVSLVASLLAAEDFIK